MKISKKNYRGSMKMIYYYIKKHSTSPLCPWTQTSIMTKCNSKGKGGQ